MAAITAAKEGAAVTVLEAMEKPGKKILITGNGRCNLTNLDFSRNDIYRSDSMADIRQILDQFDQQDTISFFHGIGILTHERNQGIYPITDQSSSVTDGLILEARRLKVKIKCNEKAEKIIKDGDIWKVKTSSWTYEGDKVILACGGKSYPQTGSDGNGYKLAEQQGIRMNPVMPALVPLLVTENLPSKISGVRSSAKVTLEILDQKKVRESYTESGEVQWTDYGVSGIVIFQLSRYAVKAIQRGYLPKLKIDVLPDHTEEELYAFLKNREPYGTAMDAICGILPKKMASVILSNAGCKPDMKFEQVSDDILRKIIKEMKEICLTVKGSKSFDMAQVCQGGVDLDQIDLATMEYRKKKGLYATGELLDVDGICGG